MKKQMSALVIAAATLTLISNAMAAELPVEDYQGGIGDGPTTPAPTLSAGDASRTLPVEHYPGDTGGGGQEDPDVTISDIKEIIVSILTHFKR